MLKDSTEELGGTKEEDEEKGIPDCSEGDEGGDLSIADTTREPRLTVEEKTRLLNCERPCAKEEWMAMSVKDNWQTLTVMKFELAGQKKVGIEEKDTKESTPKAPPASANRRRLRRLEVIEEKQKGNPKEKNPKEKENKKERAGLGDKKEEKNRPK